MRFFIPPSHWPADSAQAVLDGAESRHAATVLRVQPGDSLEVFDGAGRAATAIVSSVTKSQVHLQLAPSRTTPPPAARLVLAVAVPKGASMDWIIEKAVELGATEIVPLLTQRTVVRVPAPERPERQRKWQRLATEACKQCGQNWLPLVHPPRPLPEALATLPPASFGWPLVACLQPDARPLRTVLHRLPPPSPPAPADAAIWIGPEGDFTPDEYTELRSTGLHPVSLGPIILRVETAALFCLSILRYHAEPPAP
jgi:16S rRNA (uracil1498-N3)-methyltransferase